MARTTSKSRSGSRPRSARVAAVLRILPWVLARDLRALDVTVSPVSILVTYLVVVAAGVGAGVALMLPVACIVVLVIVAMLFAPAFVYNAALDRYESNRFTDVVVYIRQMLYAFSQSSKVLDSLGEVRVLFRENTRMRRTVDEAVRMIGDPSSQSTDVEADALALVEKTYPSRHVIQLHRFMLTVERVGGDFTASTNLLLDSCAAWEARTRRLRDRRRMKRRDILISLFASAGLVAFMLRILHDGAAAAATPLVAGVDTLMVIVYMLIYLRAEHRLAADLLGAHTGQDERLAVVYDKYVNYQWRHDFRASLAWSLIPLALMGWGWAQHMTVVLAVGCVLLPIMLMQHEISHRLKRRELVREIAVAFPQWLMEIALLLQTENVQVAIFRSVDDAIPVLRPALTSLRDQLSLDPTSSAPYFAFLAPFNLTDVTMSMRMLYSLSQGTSRDSNQQIATIVRNNTASLERAEDAREGAQMASMSLLFYAPSLVGSLVLLVDMTVYMVTLMAQMGGLS